MMKRLALVQIDLRRATPRDLPVLLGFEKGYMMEIEPEHLPRWQAHEDKQLQALAENLEHMVVADGPDGLIGHCFWSYVATRPTICSIYVLPEWRRKGIARELLSWAERDIKAFDEGSVHLATRSHNPAQHLFAKAGYELQEDTKGWLSFTKPFTA